MGDTVLTFPTPEEERARRLKVEVERLARLPTVEWMLYVSTETHAAKYGIDCATLKRMVEAVIKEVEKTRQAQRIEQRRVEDRAERAQDRAARQAQREQKRRDDAAEKAAAKAEKLEHEKREAFASIVELPSAMHEARLAELAKRLGEDAEVLSAEFAVFADGVERRGAGDIEPWPEPVETKALLAAMLAQLQRYLVMCEDEYVAVGLWVMFAWVHRHAATHSPLLTFRSPAPNTGKTVACGVVRFLSPRSAAGGELTGPSLYRFVDHAHPTLIIDDADRLFRRRPDLAHIVNVGWTRGTLIPRVVNRVVVWFDPFCPKIIAGRRLSLPDTTETRTINVKLKRKLPAEKVEHFGHEDDEAFYTLRRKAARWAGDNARALKQARPALPDGFDNRLADNWRVLLAIADLAGGRYPATARATAVRLSRQPELGEEIRLLGALREMFVAQAELTSAEVVAHLTADPASEWYAFHDRGPITQRQVAFLLRDFDIAPVVLHPTKRKTQSPRGYKRGHFVDAFVRYLPKRK